MDKGLSDLLNTYLGELKRLPNYGFPLACKAQSTLNITICLSAVYRHLNDDPIATITACLNHEIAVLKNYFTSLSLHIVPEEECTRRYEMNMDRTQTLFEEAWTTYTEETYEHSVQLIEERFRASGLDEAFFEGKKCFDGGCGTGRLSIAMARMGAKEVVACDIGQRSLDYMEQVAKRYGLQNITCERRDVTDLSDIADGSYDFVSSYGVLHHTEACLKGVKHHYRITKPGGTFWLYLYGKGGIYWEIYDRIRDALGEVDFTKIKEFFVQMGVREGLIYTYLDNMYASREYYFESEIIEMLNAISPLSAKRAQGPSWVDDTNKVLESKYGSVVVGPEGEVRLMIEKL